MAVHSGDWVRTCSKGVWQVMRELPQHYAPRYSLAAPLELVPEPIFVLKRLVDDKWKKAFVTEPDIVERINRSLAKIKRSTSKATQKSLLDGMKPFVHKHYHWNLNRDCGVYFELLQNKDLKGKLHCPRNADMGLLLIFVLQEHAFRGSTPTKKSLEYASRILKCLAVDYTLIAEGADRERVEARMLQMQ